MFKNILLESGNIKKLTACFWCNFHNAQNQEKSFNNIT